MGADDVRQRAGAVEDVTLHQRERESQQRPPALITQLLQAVIFVSFLWELGYQSWGPLLTFPFALVQGYIFNRTRSLPYVVCTHLIFDCVLFLVLLHAHNPGWLPIFIY